MRRGQRDEPIARDLFIKEYGINMVPACIESETYNFLGASLDGLSDCGEILLEVKSQHPVEHIPEDHMCQMQHAMLTSDGRIKKAYYVSHWEGRNTVFEAYPDKNWQDFYIYQAREFWKRIVFFDAPPLSSRDYRDMSSKEDWNVLASEYLRVENDLKKLEEAKASLKSSLINMCEDQSSMGSGIKVIKKLSKGRIDYKEACELLNIREDQLEHYRKEPSSTWAIMIDR